ncbi:cobyrinate a,c-diamide synthase [Anaerovorax odorimutans]|nr:cobyrinate a,c-diamide synthase [Anaerovorax odorimutans]
MRNVPRILIGASGSGCGKTTFTCGLLQALKNMGKHPAAFKCGPDYIDPMFHSEVLEVPSRNLDLFFAESNTVRFLLSKHTAEADIAVMEGVMGYYDGLAGISPQASSYDLALKTRTPAVLLLDGRGKSLSLLAEIKGFLELEEESMIRGVILNRVSEMIYPQLKEMVEERLPVKVYGYLPKMDDCGLESRHLGLVTAAEIKDLRQIICRLAEQLEKSVDLAGLMALACSAAPLCCQEPVLPQRRGPKVRIGLARDKAFCFYYQDNLDLLSELGAELVPFSPLEDDHMPEGLDGLMIGGGYPELYLRQLSENVSMREHIKKAITAGLPCQAECGGFMYLHETVKAQDGSAFPLVGLIAGESYPLGKLSRFGYITLTAGQDTMLCKKGESIKGHEFHYWDSTCAGDAFHARKPLRKKAWDCIVAGDNLFAGYPHIYYYSNPAAAERFLAACRAYKELK